MSRTEFNLMFWGSFIACGIARPLITEEFVHVALNISVLIFWGWAIAQRCQSINWPQAMWLLVIVPFVNLLFALVIGIYQPTVDELGSNLVRKEDTE